MEFRNVEFAPNFFEILSFPFEASPVSLSIRINSPILCCQSPEPNPEPDVVNYSNQRASNFRWVFISDFARLSIFEYEQLNLQWIYKSILDH
jgi:hypothetical protein